MTSPAPKPSSITAFLVSEVRKLAGHALPDDVLEMARHCLLDWFGIAIGGAREPLVLKLLEEAREQGGHAQSTVIWHGERTSAALAALVNGSAADALDFSDAHLAMRGHTTPAVVATSLVLAESRGASGREFLAAIVAGVEMECRVGLLVAPPYLRWGFHPTGNLAPFGATAAAAQLLGLEPDRWAHALGIAATQAAGLLASGGTMSKPFHSGKAATNGLLAARLAHRDFIARPDAIEAPEGFVDTHATGRHEDLLYGSAGRYLILDTIFKSHAACQLTHSSIENMLALQHDHAFKPEDVVRIELEVPTRHLGVCNIQEPRTGLEGKFSLRATAAMALLGDDTRDIAAYDAERMKSAELMALRDRVHVSPRDDLEGGTSNATIELKDGRRLSASTDTYKPLGNLELQLDIVSRKFFSLVAPVLGEKRAARLREAILETDRLPSVQPLIELSNRDA
ncbi:MAG: hypothetical protein A3I01_01950 [Betaproteobacteria bacterium RIFCSPLOWO2_02_FULL_65_24]|nr:MAG: hypothetical protein A3I01_01950 [Betaproteobacteria bacterium RIFCSPLOWO2_02_FULL_65_24]OGA34236.1 MAG: hypothetical protein A3G80_10105 [Betaproteobacteria bacterium RIFCSPLOWO2_12_FULL_62_13b]